MPYDERLAARIRNILAARSDVVERTMMGGRCFLVGGHLCCGVHETALLLRVGREAYPALLERRHVRAMALGGRAPLGYVLIDPPGCASDATLAAWIDRGLAVVDALATAPPSPSQGVRGTSKRR